MSGARTYRQRVQNGQVVSRAGANGRRGGASKRSGRSSQRGGSGRRGGQSVFVYLLCFGAFITIVGVLSLRNLRQAHLEGMTNADLQTQFHRLVNARQDELLKKQVAYDEAERMVLLDPNLTAPRVTRTAPPEELGEADGSAVTKAASQRQASADGKRSDSGRREKQVIVQRRGKKTESPRKSRKGLMVRSAAVKGGSRPVDRQ